MKPEWVFPSIMVVLQVAAAVVYGCRGQIKGCLYWLLAAAITSVVTYMKR